MDIDKIKWMVGYAEGFEYCLVGGHESVKLTYEKYEHFVTIVGFLMSPLYRILLQSAIEGINTNSEYKIISDEVTYTVFVKNNAELLTIAELKNGKRLFDEAKESALDYVYEQEKINEDKK